MLKIILATVQREFIALSRKHADWLLPIAFFTIFVVIFPLATDMNQQSLTMFAPAIIWVSALLVNILTLDKIFKDDYDNGSLEQMIITPFVLFPIVIGKIFSHWCAMGLPLLIFAPIYGYMLGLSTSAIWILVVVLALVTPTLSLLGTLGSALTVSIRQSGALLALMMLPLYIPLLIFSANAVNLTNIGLNVDAVIAMLGAILILSMLLLPWLICTTLRIIIE